jgi:type IX secretion system PorP/SprF family membrane protein
MRKILFTLMLGLVSVAIFAQEQAIYNHYPVLPVYMNPAATAFNNKHQLIGNARTSWTGFPGQPKAFTLMYNGPVGDKLALGGGLFSERLGDLRTTRVSVNYAFRFQLNKARIGLGLSTEFLNRKLDNDLLGNALVDPGDLIVEQMAEGQSIFDATMGAYMVYDERFILGFTLPNAIRARLDDVPTVGNSEESNQFKHFTFQLGYVADLQAYNCKITPTLTMRQFRDTPSQLDLNVTARFLDDRFIAGITYRPSYKGTAMFLIGSKYQQFEAYYSYDVAFSNFQSYSGGSHELTLAYNIPRKAKAAVNEGTPVDPYK